MIGTIIQHGNTTSDNYFIKLHTSMGAKTLWSKEFKDVLKKANLNIGDKISISRTGQQCSKEPIMIREGNSVYRSYRTTYRSTFKIKKLEKTPKAKITTSNTTMHSQRSPFFETITQVMMFVLLGAVSFGAVALAM